MHPHMIRAQPMRVSTTLILFVLLCGLMGCDPKNPSDSSPGDEPSDDAAASDQPTIISMTPAITQMLIDMGKRDQIIGVSSDDDTSLGLPACGSYNDPVIAKILELDPDLVITESPFDDGGGVPPMLKSLSDQGIYKLAVIRHCRSVAEVERALVDPKNGLGQIVGDLQAAENARALMNARLDMIDAVVADAKPPRVLMLINPTTLGAIGTGVTHDELLQRASGTNAAKSFSTGYVTLTRAQVQQVIRPDVILIFEPGGSPIRDNDPRLSALEGLAIPAVTNRRIVVIRHPQAMLPSTTLPEVLAQIAMAIHPDRAEAIERAYAMAERVGDKP